MQGPQLVKAGIKIVPTRKEHVWELERLQEIVFPNLCDSQRIKAGQYLNQIKNFPEGQFVAVKEKDETIVGMTTTLRVDESKALISHSFEEIFKDGNLDNHDPNGEWLYGLDLGTHPDYRGLGIGRALYNARKNAVEKLNLKGQVTVGMLNGYQKAQAYESVDEYYLDLKNGKIKDPTVSMQQKIGFKIKEIVKDYLDDPTCGNAGVLLMLEK